MTTNTKHYTLEEIKELLAKATPGPWVSAEQPFGGVRVWAQHGTSIGIADVLSRAGVAHPAQASCVANAQLIAAAPTIIAQLVEQVEKSELYRQNDENEIKKLKAQVDWWMEDSRVGLEKTIELQKQVEKLQSRLDEAERNQKTHDDLRQQYLRQIDDLQTKNERLDRGYRQAVGRGADIICELKQRNTQLLELLREVEWAGADGIHSACPVCKWRYIDRKHAPDCKLAQVLGTKTPGRPDSDGNEKGAGTAEGGAKCDV